MLKTIKTSMIKHIMVEKTLDYIKNMKIMNLKVEEELELENLF